MLASCASGGSRTEAINTCSVVSSEDILKAIKDMIAEISIKFENVMSAVDNEKNDVKECAGKISQAEVRISGTEDNIIALQGMTTTLEEKIESLTSKLVDLEGRSRRSNLRLVHLPGGAEGSDACVTLV
jgi:predicted  nucleic acid-binding Zn-ribbon protein